MANKIEREAGDQRHRRYFFWIQNGSVFRRNNTNIFYNVLVCVPRLNQLNDIALGNALQTAEKAISMPCDSQVARLADAGCSENRPTPRSRVRSSVSLKTGTSRLILGIRRMARGRSVFSA